MLRRDFKLADTVIFCGDVKIDTALKKVANPSVSEYQEVIGITKENVDRLTVVIQDLLYFNTEFDDDQYEDFWTDELFEKILSDLSKSINQKHIKVIHDGSINIRGERRLLERAFFNLVQNAVKYNKDNGIIKITSQGDMITLEDSGIGIPEDSISQIFDPFYCVDKSRSRNLGGSGLGLSIVKQVFDKHNMLRKLRFQRMSQQGGAIYIYAVH